MVDLPTLEPESPGSAGLPARLAALIADLERAASDLDPARAHAILRSHDLQWEDVAAFVAESERGYTRRRVARHDAFEVLVMTWRAGQQSSAHDHAGSRCGTRVIQGRVAETRYRLVKDGCVEPDQTSHSGPGEVTFDAGGVIHRLAHAGDPARCVVTLHVYAPPLPELRRYALRPAGQRVAALFTRRRTPDATSVCIVGGGFSGTMVAAQLIKGATAQGRALHVTLCERHSAHGEGPAYRTADARHLLNVPAARMSAWPDRPDDFLEWMRARGAQVSPSDFLPRSSFGEYLRDSFTRVADAAGERVSAEIRHEDVCQIREHAQGWRLSTSSGARLDANAVVLATGHRPPDDPLGRRWTGARTRLIADPWASLTLSAIGPDEPVLILGTGLTAIDVLLTLGRERRAPIIALSRRGLLPAAHAPAPLGSVDAERWLAPLLEGAAPLQARALLRALREQLRVEAAAGRDWRPLIDGLRPYTARLWAALPELEAARFLRHLRPFWEVHRHRMAPSIAATVNEMRAEGSLRALAGRVLAARGDGSGVTLEVCARGTRATQTLRVAWVVNCTGPGGDGRTRTEPVVASLLEAGQLQADRFGLGVLTGPAGEARARSGRLRSDLLVVGTLRKPQLWESTAVPELRVQAAQAAATLLELERAPPEQRAPLELGAVALPGS